MSGAAPPGARGLLLQLGPPVVSDSHLAHHHRPGSARRHGRPRERIGATGQHREGNVRPHGVMWTDCFCLERTPT